MLKRCVFVSCPSKILIFLVDFYVLAADDSALSIGVSVWLLFWLSFLELGFAKHNPVKKYVRVRACACCCCFFFFVFCKSSLLIFSLSSEDEQKKARVRMSVPKCTNY